MEKLTIQEEEVMLHIWSMGECFVKDIVAKFPEPKPPYTTVASIVNNLKRKGYVTAKRFGNTYQYTPVVKQSEYKRTFVSGVVRNYFADFIQGNGIFLRQRAKNLRSRLERHYQLDRERRR